MVDNKPLAGPNAAFYVTIFNKTSNINYGSKAIR